PIMARIGRAVGAAHRAGVCHRDLKPDNVLVTPDLEPRVVDFGLATAAEVERLTKSGAFVGTIGYMAPEQLEGRRADQAPPMDVYSLGVILYELATGAPIATGSVSEVMAQVISGNHELASEKRPGLPRELDRVIERALSVAPAARYADGDAFAEAVEDLER